MLLVAERVFPCTIFLKFFAGFCLISKLKACLDVRTSLIKLFVILLMKVQLAPS